MKELWTASINRLWQMRIALLICIMFCSCAECFSKDIGGVDIEKYGAIYGDRLDDSKALQTAINDQKEIIISGDIVIGNNIYIWGQTKIIGKNNGSITLVGDFEKKDGKKFVINCGITGKQGKTKTWEGEIRNIDFIGSHSAQFNYCIQLHSVKGVLIDNNTFDFRNIPQSETRGDGRGGAIEGLNDRNWNKGNMSRTNITISNNRVLNRQNYPGQEGMGISNAQNVTFKGNYIYGMADDGIALHNVKDFNISSNSLYLVAGRIYVADSREGVIRDNYIERIPMQISRQWMNSESYIKIEPERRKGSSPVNRIENIHIVNNTINIPDSYRPLKKSKTYVIRVIGIRDCLIKGNKLNIQCDKDFVTSPIVIENPHFKSSKIGELQWSNEQINNESQDVIIVGNLLKGRGASSPKVLGINNPKNLRIYQNIMEN